MAAGCSGVGLNRFISWWGDDWPETVNTLILSEEDGKTTITSTVLYPATEARDAALRTGMTEGRSASVDRLEEYPGTRA